jgi:hypothetical protein
MKPKSKTPRNPFDNVKEDDEGSSFRMNALASELKTGSPRISIDDAKPSSSPTSPIEIRRPPPKKPADNNKPSKYTAKGAGVYTDSEEEEEKEEGEITQSPVIPQATPTPIVSTLPKKVCYKIIAQIISSFSAWSCQK